MRNAWYIAVRELKAYFVSPIAYVVMAVFLLLSGYFFHRLVSLYSFLSVQYMSYQAYIPQFTVHDFITRRLVGQMVFLFIILVPVITMRLLAEEKKLGTYELLLTSPLRTGEIVAGKFLSSLLLYAIILALTLEFPLFLYHLGGLDVGPTVTSYVGFLLIGGAFLAVGLFSSAVTENQIVAAVLSFVILLLFWIVGWTSPATAPVLRDVLTYLSLSEEHLDNFTKGIVDTRDIVYFLSFTLFWLFLTFRVLESERWRE